MRCHGGDRACAAAAYSLDRGRCIVCGACVEQAPDRFSFRPEYETASRQRSALVVGASADADPQPVRAALGDRVRALRRSVHIRHVDAGSDGAEEWEIQALPIRITTSSAWASSSPRHRATQTSCSSRAG